MLRVPRIRRCPPKTTTRQKDEIPLESVNIRTDWIARGVLAVIIGWLILAAWTIQIDFDDGYATIANARHFL